MIEFNILQILTGTDGAEVFNYFFTLIFVFGFIALGIGLLVKVLTRS